MLDKNEYQKLIQINKELRTQLAKAHMVISTLKEENTQLKNKLARF